MLRIRFDDDGVTVYSVVGDAATLEVKENYANVKVEVMTKGRFWHRLADPLKAIRLAAYANAMMSLFVRRDDKETREL